MPRTETGKTFCDISCASCSGAFSKIGARAILKVVLNPIGETLSATNLSPLLKFGHFFLACMKMGGILHLNILLWFATNAMLVKER